MERKDDARKFPAKSSGQTSLRPVPNTYQVHIAAISALLPGDSPRHAEDAEHVHRLMQIESRLPPILVHRPTMRVIDGAHRLKAAILKGQEEVEVVFYDGTEDDAFLRAVEENISHGLPLSLADRRAAARRIIASHPHLSDRSIATYTGLSARTVGALRRGSTEDSPQLSRRLGTDGRSRPLNGAEGRLRAAQVIAQNPDASVRQVARIAGVSVGTAHDVRVRIRRGEDPLPTGRQPPGGLPKAAPTLAPRRSGGPAAHDARRDSRRHLQRTDRPDIPAMLQKLMRDPALRHTDVGRELLRLLHTQSLTVTDLATLIEAIPPHCTDSVARIARRCAERWNQLAQEIERR